MNKQIKRTIKTGSLLLAALVLVACGEAETEDIQEISFEPKVSEQEYLDIRAERQDEYLGILTGGETPEIKALDDTHYKKLNYDQAKEFIEQKKSGIIYFGWTECPYCFQLRQSFDTVLEDLEQDVYIIERSDFISKAKQNEIYELYDIEYVPNLLVFHEGKEVTRMGENLLLNTQWYPDLLDWVVDMSKVVVEGPANNQDLIDKHTESEEQDSEEQDSEEQDSEEQESDEQESDEQEQESQEQDSEEQESDE